MTKNEMNKLLRAIGNIMMEVAEVENTPAKFDIKKALSSKKFRIVIRNNGIVEFWQGKKVFRFREEK